MRHVLKLFQHVESGVPSKFYVVVVLSLYKFECFMCSEVYLIQHCVHVLDNVIMSFCVYRRTYSEQSYVQGMLACQANKSQP